MGGWCFGGNPMVECTVKCDSQLQYIPIATDFAQLHAAGWRQNWSGMVYIGIIFSFFKSQMVRNCPLMLTGFLSVRFMGTFWELFSQNFFFPPKKKVLRKKFRRNLQKSSSISGQLFWELYWIILHFCPLARGHPNILYFRLEDLCGRFLPKIFEQKIFAEDLSREVFGKVGNVWRDGAVRKCRALGPLGVALGKPNGWGCALMCFAWDVDGRYAKRRDSVFWRVIKSRGKLTRVITTLGIMCPKSAHHIHTFLSVRALFGNFFLAGKKVLRKKFPKSSHKSDWQKACQFTKAIFSK